jgi:hypothetical protein
VGTVVTCALVALISGSGTAESSAAPTHNIRSIEPPFGASLNSRMSTLFHDIALDSLPRAEKVFFPESAYVAMKTGEIPSPATDYVDRLIGFLQLDLGAYHAMFFSHGPSTFLGLNVNPADALWIRPGWCENSIGYWHVPGVRLVYRQNKVVRSVAVASLISWQGRWYVVHLGPNPRPRDVGTVDAPALGRGVPGPAGGC